MRKGRIQIPNIGLKNQNIAKPITSKEVASRIFNLNNQGYADFFGAQTFSTTQSTSGALSETRN